MELIEVPKTGRKLPDTLSTTEIDQLIAAIDLSKPEMMNESLLFAFGTAIKLILKQMHI